MKKIFFIFFIIQSFSLYAQETAREISRESPEWDIDSIFNEEVKEEEQQNTQDTVFSQLKKRAVTFSADYSFNAGIAPAWPYLPHEDEFNSDDYYLERYLRMRAVLGIEAQISKELRTVSNVYFNIPQAEKADFLRIELGDFYFDYNIKDYVFIRGGKWNSRWGISPNYKFTNLLGRLPPEDPQRNSYKHDSFIFRFDIPIGVGGVQFLALTRINLLGDPNITPKLQDFGFGGKYNLALPVFDLDFGIFWQEGMPLRSFLSFKKTIFNIEFFNEYLVSINNTPKYIVSGAFNLGFGKELFDRKLALSGEILYNAEKGTEYYQEETAFHDATALNFVEGFNMAFNVLYKPFQKGNPRIFARFLFNPEQNSSQIIPGARISPLNHVEFYLAVPMSLGSRDGYYRQWENTFSYIPGVNQPLPFAVVFMLTINGSAKVRQEF